MTSVYILISHYASFVSRNINYSIIILLGYINPILSHKESVNVLS